MLLKSKRSAWSNKKATIIVQRLKKAKLRKIQIPKPNSKNGFISQPKHFQHDKNPLPKMLFLNFLISFKSSKYLNSFNKTEFTKF